MFIILILMDDDDDDDFQIEEGCSGCIAWRYTQINIPTNVHYFLKICGKIDFLTLKQMMGQKLSTKVLVHQDFLFILIIQQDIQNFLLLLRHQGEESFFKDYYQGSGSFFLNQVGLSRGKIQFFFAHTQIQDTDSPAAKMGRLQDAQNV